MLYWHPGVLRMKSGYVSVFKARDQSILANFIQAAGMSQ
jgi:hypothetical protein